MGWLRNMFSNTVPCVKCGKRMDPDAHYCTHCKTIVPAIRSQIEAEISRAASERGLDKNRLRDASLAEFRQDMNEALFKKFFIETTVAGAVGKLEGEAARVELEAIRLESEKEAAKHEERMRKIREEQEAHDRKEREWRRQLAELRRNPNDETRWRKAYDFWKTETWESITKDHTRFSPTEAPEDFIPRQLRVWNYFEDIQDETWFDNCYNDLLKQETNGTISKEDQWVLNEVRTRREKAEEEAIIARAKALRQEARRKRQLEAAKQLIEAHDTGQLTTADIDNHNTYPPDWDSLRKTVYERDGYKCGNCGVSGDEIQLHAHHIVPLAAGGTNNPSNLKTLCEDCHRRVHGAVL